MSVIRTDLWLEQYYDQPIKIADKLKSYFNNAIDSKEIHQHLVHHGMYRKKLRSDFVDQFKQMKCWDTIIQEERRLKKLWNGPDVPIFIFPSDTLNRKIVKEYNGKSGLAFNDKLFLFLSLQNEKKEIQSLFIHEYNHVCRLTGAKREEKEYTLLDSIILEGMAENAVREQIGGEFVASYINYYEEMELNKMWEKLIQPNITVTRNEKKHFDLLYGKGRYPNMAGYCVGYYIIKKVLEDKKLTTTDILNWSSNKIVKAL